MLSEGPAGNSACVSRPIAGPGAKSWATLGLSRVLGLPAQVVGVDPDRDRAVVHQRHLHMGAEAAGFDA